jgi:hypothetical protein
VADYAIMDVNYATETPDFPPAAEMHRYLVSYAEHFGILPRARLSTTVHRAEWNPDTALWEVETSTETEPKTVQYFDKVVYSMGPDQTPNIPSVPGLELFGSEAVHSIEFKRYVLSESLRCWFSTDKTDRTIGPANEYLLSALEIPRRTWRVSLRERQRRFICPIEMEAL